MPHANRDAKGRLLKGCSGNPDGLRKEFKDLYSLQRHSRHLTNYAILKTAHMSLEKLAKVLENNPETKSIEAVVARLYSKAIAGSLPHAALILDRIIGPVPKNIVTTDEDGKTKPMSVNITPDRLLALMVKLNELPEDEECRLIPNPLESSQPQSHLSSAQPSTTEL